MVRHKRRLQKSSQYLHIWIINYHSSKRVSIQTSGGEIEELLGYLSEKLLGLESSHVTVNQTALLLVHPWFTRRLAQ